MLFTFFFSQVMIPKLHKLYYDTHDHDISKMHILVVHQYLTQLHIYIYYIFTLVNIKKLLISKRRIGILKKLPKQGEDSESL